MLITVSSSNSGGSSWDRAFECQRRLLLIYLHLICPTGRRFWLWRRDLSKTEPLASVRVSAAAVVAQHIFATLMTPTRDYIHSYTDHQVISLEARRHSSCTIQDVCRIFATRHFYFLKTNISISICQCQRVLIHYLLIIFQEERHIYCAQLHSFSWYTP